MPSDPPLNALPPGRQPRLTVPDVDRPPVLVRVVLADGDHQVAGTARGWTAEVVCVHWTDLQGYGRIDWFPAGDVERA